MKWTKTQEKPAPRPVQELWTVRDEWGPCCPACPWRGQPHKPCSVCEKAKRG